MKARRYDLAPLSVAIYLRTKDYRGHGMELKLSRKTANPNELVAAVKPAFLRVFQRGEHYRSTGVALFDLRDDSAAQLDLFGAR